MPDLENDVARRTLKIAQELAHADHGERAAARRMTAEGAPVFWRLAARLGIGEHEEEKWRRITKALALLTPSCATESVHETGREFGAVLADGGDAFRRLRRPVFSEQRLARLLAARGSARLDAIERAVRMLARRHARIDAPSLAWACLNDGEQTTRAIARAYYRRCYPHQDSSQEKQSDA